MVTSYFIYFGLIVIEFLVGNYLCNQYEGMESRTKSFRYVSKKQLLVGFIILIMALIPACIAGFRYDVGGDYWNYERINSNYIRTSVSSMVPDKLVTGEIGFFLLAKVLAAIGGNYQTLLFVSGFIIYVFMIKGMIRAEDKKNLGIMCLIYFCLLFGPSFNIIKQMIAGAIILWGFPYIYERKLKAFIIVALVATTFHISAILFIVLYFLYSESTDYKSLIKELAVVIFAIILPIVFELLFSKLTAFSFFSEYGSSYSEMFTKSGTIKSLILRFPAIVPVVFSWKQVFKGNPKSHLYLMMLILEYSTITLSFSMHWSFRISYYFATAEMLMASQVLSANYGTKKTLWKLYYILYYILYFYMVFYVWGDDGLFPYKSILGLN